MCDCVKRVNEGLAASNACLAEITLMNFETGKMRQSLRVMTERLSSKTKKWTRSVIPNYCPFCGEKIARSDEAEG